MQNRGDTLIAQQRQIAGLDRERVRLGGELAATRAYYTNAASEISRQFVELQRLATTRGALESRLFATQVQLGDVESRYVATRQNNSALDQKVANLHDRLKLRDAANQLLAQRLAETGSALAGATTGHQEAQRARRENQRQLAELNASLQNSHSLNNAVRTKLEDQENRVETLSEARDLAETKVRQLNSRLAAVNSDLLDTQHSNLSLRRRLAATTDALTVTHQNQVNAENRGMDLASNVGTLEKRLDQVRATQLELLRGIRTKARRNIASIQATLSQTGIPLQELLQNAIPRKDGIGGPLILTDDIKLDDAGTSFEGMVGGLELELQQWEGMQKLMAHLPLTRPTVSGYVSSPFGKRRDPMTRRRAMHKGVDIAAPLRTPIYATASGVVSFAGTKAAYGRMVEIDHGFGFVTRYAHLRQALVKTGERVTFHQKIATMGSTGRSTGSHVHYEVLYRGEQMDPVNFFEAGRYVFKIENAKGPEDQG